MHVVVARGRTKTWIPTRRLDAIATCHRGLGYQIIDWIEDNARNPDALIVAASESAAAPQIAALLCCELDRHAKSAEIVYVCSKTRGGGSATMRKLFEELRKLDIEVVEVVSALKAHSFYQKMGFRRGPANSATRRSNERNLRARFDVFVADMPRYASEKLVREAFDGMMWSGEEREGLPTYHKMLLR